MGIAGRTSADRAVQECERKFKFPTEEAAQDMIDNGADPVDRPFLHAYKCRFCDHWHMGHRRGSGRRLSKMAIKKP
jgi:hypothetical protein